MRNIAVIDETFDINISSTYHLAIQLSAEGLCFAIMDTVRKKYIALKDLFFDEALSLSKEEQVENFFTRDNHLNHRYKTSGLIYATPNAVLIPKPLFDPGTMEEMYHFSNQLPENHVILSNDIANIDSKIVFSLPESILNSCNKHPNEIRIYHQSCPEIENAALAARSKPSGNYVKVHLYRDFFDIVVFRKGKFELFNSFSYQTQEDLIFYILYVFEQLDFEAEKNKLVLSGNVVENSELTDKLSQFIPDIILEKFNKNFNYSYTFGQLSQHRFSNLVSLYLCV